VFSTKKRQRWINQSLQPRLFAYLSGACRTIGCNAYRVGGTEDHIHIACTLPRTLTVSKLLEEIKKSSSAWIKGQDNKLRSFSWQAGYGVFSLGESQLSQLVRYIDNQRDHHRKITFQEEFLDLILRYGIEHNERYLWD
jgi:putative transposase